MFGADNCRAGLPQPGTQLVAGGLASGTAYQTTHLAHGGIRLFHYTRFKMYPNTALPKYCANSLSWLLCLQNVFFVVSHIRRGKFRPGIICCCEGGGRKGAKGIHPFFSLLVICLPPEFQTRRLIPFFGLCVQ